jgi:putative nucleotide binding protein
MKEAIVLDKAKKEIQYKQTDFIQCIGTSNFSILEIIGEYDVKIQEKISTENQIVKRITYNKLTTIAKKELEKAIENIVLENEEKFVNFFNNAKPIGTRRHQLDLLPLIGKKHRMAILNYLDRKGKFTCFNDFKKIEMMPNPVHVIVERVIEEIINGPDEKHHLFTMPFFKKKDFI